MPQRVILDGNEAAARVAYLASEVIAIYPITPASPMGELADQWAATGRPNLWGAVPRVVELQSEGGAAGAVHGALQTGALTTTFTASQGLLLMIPNMYKIAGELTSAVIHVAARSLATHALSIFCDHGDVMAARATGFAMLFGCSVEEAADFALVSHAATLEARVPFLHIFDGFRTSHELNTVTPPTEGDVRALLDPARVAAHRARALRPEAPVIRGTAQNPDVFFQSREVQNPFYRALPAIVQGAFDRLAARTGRAYRLFDYVGHPEAERVIVMMGSGAGAAEEAVERLVAEGERVGLVKVRLFRPLSAEHLVAALPASTRAVAVLDRTKEPGAAGEPLYLDVLAALSRAHARFAPAGLPRVLGGRYGLGSKEFTPAMAKATLDHLADPEARHDFVVGVVDDVSGAGLPWDPAWSTEDADTVRAVFFGLGSDGTVGANKNSVAIIGEGTDLHAQGYFVYDSKKSGAMTVSHLRFGPRPIRATYLIAQADFVACHQAGFLDRVDVLARAAPGATVLLNAPWPADAVWEHLPPGFRREVLDKGLALHTIDADALAREVGLGRRINTIMQVCFFALSGVLPRDEAIAAIKAAIVRSYGKRGEAVVRRNLEAVDATLAHLARVEIPADAAATLVGELAGPTGAVVPVDAPAFVRDVTAPMIAARGDALPVSAMPVDGTYPVGTTRYEKRNIAPEIPVWDESICIQCGKCVLVCPHSVIRAKVVDPAALADAPPTFKSARPRWRELADEAYALQVAPEDCTGCALCVEVCPVKNKAEVRLKAINMAPIAPLRDAERDNWEFFLGLPETARDRLDHHKVKDAQLLEPLFEFSGACAGCGETPYIRLATQLFGDRMVVANATGCSSIYGGNLPTTPWTTNRAGRGPAWSNSLFEDNAEFGLGMRVAIDTQAQYARDLVRRLAPELGADLADAIVSAEQRSEAEIDAQRERVAALEAALEGLDSLAARDLRALTGALVRKSVWLIGGDGWAYDIGYGGLDHVFASGWDVNILVLDTEVYSNTGGQMSKATPRAAVAKFAHGGKPTAKKDLGLMAMSYGGVYVARVALGADDKQTLRAFHEAEAWPGPSLIIAYSPCIAHGYDLRYSLDQASAAVASGHWPLFRYHPGRGAEGQSPLTLDSKAPSISVEKYAYQETRYTMLVRANPEQARALMKEAQLDADARWSTYQFLAERPPTPQPGEE